jgi:UPF0271 protein
MKLNADMGESFGHYQLGNDAALMPHLHMANIACGFHASDPVVMTRTVGLAKVHGVSIGAHPGYPDLVGFGRRSMACTPDEVRGIIWYQVGALSAIAAANGCQVDFVKPHGALYNDMMQDQALLVTIMEAVAALKPALPLMIQATTRNETYRALAKDIGCHLLFEAFADRACHDDGTLVSRSTSGAVITDPQMMVSRAQQLLDSGTLTSITGKEVALMPDTLCVHGDNDAAIQAIADLRRLCDAV